MNAKKNVFFTPKDKGENRYFIENFNPNINAENNYVYLLEQEVEPNSKILDLGCAQGRFGNLAGDKNCQIIGIELDQKAAEIAKESGNYKEVFIADMTDKTSQVYADVLREAPFDYIIMTDILEHVVEPTELLLMYEKVLKDNGKILISVPNFANIEVVLNLLKNRISYEKIGILDNTHLKWFTKPSFIEWIQQINETYEEIKLDCRYLTSTEAKTEYISELENMYPELYKVLSKRSNFMSLQLLFVLEKRQTKEEVVNLYRKVDGEIDMVKMVSDALNEGSAAVLEIENYKRIIAEQQEKQEEIYNEWQLSIKANEEIYANWQAALRTVSHLESQLEEARRGWSECSKYWNDAVAACDKKDEEKKELAEKYKERIEIQKRRVSEIYTQLEEMESSITPILERDLELQNENNCLREKVRQYENK